MRFFFLKRTWRLWYSGPREVSYMDKGGLCLSVHLASLWISFFFKVVFTLH